MQGVATRLTSWRRRRDWEAYGAPHEEGSTDPQVDQCRAGVCGVIGCCQADGSDQVERQHGPEYSRFEKLRYREPVEAGQSGSKAKDCEQGKDLGEHQLRESEGIVESWEYDERRHQHGQHADRKARRSHQGSGCDARPWWVCMVIGAAAQNLRRATTASSYQDDGK